MGLAKKIHLWVGTTSLSDEQFMNYFEEDDEGNIEGFAKDLGVDFIDLDFLLVPEVFPEVVPINELFLDSPLSSSQTQVVIQKCIELGINEGNALFWYSDMQDNSIPNIDKSKKYNNLNYIGSFEV